MRSGSLIRLLACATLAGSATLVTVALPNTSAWATPLTVSCSHIKNATPTSLDLTHCTGTDASETGSTGIEGFITSHHAKVVWKSKKTSIVSHIKTTHPTKNHCPSRTGLSNPVVTTYSGTVSGGTATGLIGGAYHASVCTYSKNPAKTFAFGPQVF